MQNKQFQEYHFLKKDKPIWQNLRQLVPNSHPSTKPKNTRWPIKRAQANRRDYTTPNKLENKHIKKKKSKPWPSTTLFLPSAPPPIFSLWKVNPTRSSKKQKPKKRGGRIKKKKEEAESKIKGKREKAKKKKEKYRQIGNTLVRQAATFIRRANCRPPFRLVFNRRKSDGRKLASMKERRVALLRLPFRFSRQRSA